MKVFKDGIAKDPSKMMKYAEKIWKELDDMKAKDPKSYNDFVGDQISEGKKSIQEEREKEVNEKGIVSDHWISVKVKALDLPKKSTESPEIKLFEIGKDELKESGVDTSKAKYLDKPEIYLNINHSEHVKEPIDENFDLVGGDNKKWKLIPVSFAKEGKLDENLLIYDAHISSLVVQKCKEDPNVMG